jgi:hypothetical protein
MNSFGSTYGTLSSGEEDTVAKRRTVERVSLLFSKAGVLFHVREELPLFHTQVFVRPAEVCHGLIGGKRGTKANSQTHMFDFNMRHPKLTPGIPANGN